MMHLYKDKDKRVEFQKVVLILVVMDDALVPEEISSAKLNAEVLILVVMDDALVLSEANTHVYLWS